MRRDILDTLNHARAEQRPVVLATDLQSGEQALMEDGRCIAGPLAIDQALGKAGAEAVRLDVGSSVEVAGRRIFLHPFNPPLRLAIVGAVHIAQPLASMALLAGYGVTVIDPRGAFATPARFPGITLSHDWPDEALEAMALDARTALVALTHDPKIDDPALMTGLQRPCFYIAALGSRKTNAARLIRLGGAGVDRQALGRIHGPAGLAIGAKSPAEIAVSIMAQMTEALRQPAPARRQMASA